MTSYKLANYIILRNTTLRDRCLPYLFVSDRSFCSKEKEIKKDASIKNDSKEKEESEEEVIEAKASSPEDAGSSDATKSAAKQKLMSLLSNIKVTANKPSKPASELKLAKPLKRISKKERLKQMQAEIVTPEKEMDMAVKAVASSFKEDSEKIESELASKVSSLRLTKTTLVEEDDSNKENPEINNEMNEKLMSSVEEVADTISESPIPPRSELAERLMRLSVDQKLRSEKKSMRSVIKGMAIEPQQPVPLPKTKIDSKQQVKKPQAAVKIGKVNLFNSTPLNIFPPVVEIKDEPSNTFWKKLEERELKLMTQFAPANAFEEMIMWTEQGKHWKFPIDNQIDMGEEEKHGFHEHVFLEHHLKGFPTKGPVRHFMELVVVGLSKNPYITVERKLDHIEWFRTYFKEKEDLLREEGAVE